MKRASQNILLVFIGVIIFTPGLFYNLGIMPLIEDESIRALVALEMIISGDYWTPTLGGELYFKKPPLYNWILVIFFKLFGVSDFVFRIPVVIVLISFSYLIFNFTKKAFDRKTGLLAAMFFLTNGRVLFYESSHGLIDLLFSLIIFVNFILVFRYYKSEDYKRLFIYSYILIGIAFLLKGLPSVVFQGFTLFALFVWKRNFWKLFHKFHITGVAIFFLIIGAYYAIYFINNEGTYINMFRTLINESTRRTPIHFGLIDTLKHIVLFPFEVLYHFLPWTLLAILFLFKRTYTIIRQNDVLQYLLVMYGANIIVYWISPEVHPRYILMHMALLFIVLAKLFVDFEKENLKVIKYFNYLFYFIIGILAISPFVILFIDEFQFIKHLYLKLSIIVALNATLLFIFFKIKRSLIIYLILFIGVFRLGFDFFILEHRNYYSKSAEQRNYAITIGQATQEKTLYAYWPEIKKPDIYYGKRIMQYAPMYYITRENKQLLKSESEIDYTAYYLTYIHEVMGKNFEIKDTLNLKVGTKINMIKFLEE